MPLADFQDRFPDLCERLLRSRREDHLGHAYLFVGDDPETVADVTRAWAQVCACREPTHSGDACGQCRSCHLFQTGNYPDCHVLKPTTKSRAISVQDIRNFEHELALATDRDVIKFGLIAEAECLTDAAQNAFLKTLEEPRPGTILCLGTTQPRELLPTMRSRCQIISIRQNRRSYEWAEERGLLDILRALKPRAGAAVGLASGAALATFLSQLEDEARQTVEDEVDPQWNALAEDDDTLKKRLKEEHEARIRAEYLRLRQRFEDALHTWYLQLLLASAGAKPDRLPQPELLRCDDLENLPETHDARRAVVFVEELLDCLRTNADERLAIDTFCLSLTER